MANSGNTTVFSPRLNEIYTLDELDGIDREWAVSIVKEKIDKISAQTGIEFMREPVVYCIDSASAKKFYEKTFAYGLDPDSFALTEEKTAYFICYSNSLLGLPVTCECNDSLGSDALPSYAYGIVDSKGLVKFDLSSGSIAVSDKLEAEGMYNVDVVKLALTDEYGETTLGGLNVITDIELKYVCENISDTSERVFRPCWICYVCRLDSENTLTSGEILEHPTMVLFVDALTGELLNSSSVEKLRLSF